MQTNFVSYAENVHQLFAGKAGSYPISRSEAIAPELVCLKRRSRNHRGFTLVELMIVVAIIGILASVAIPIYSDYSVRTKLAEVILAASACRTAVSEVYMGGVTAPGAGNWGCEGNKSQYVGGITTDPNGVVTLTVQNISSAVDGMKIQMVPYTSGVVSTIASHFGNGVNEWRCGPTAAGGVDKKYLPNSCRN